MTVNLIGSSNPIISFGWLTAAFAEGFKRHGHRVVFTPLDGMEAVHGAKVPEVLRESVGTTELGVPSLLVHPSGDALINLVQPWHVVFSVWETDRLPKRWAESLSRAKAVIVPSEWCANVYKRSGVRCPVEVVHHGVDTDTFYLDPNVFPKGAVFMTAGRSLHGRARKGIDQVILAFLLAFPDETDVCLWVKSHEDCETLSVKCPRVQYISKFLPATELARMYRESLCFVSGAAAEGWGLHQHEAMACGRAVVSVNWGGVKTFFKPKVNGIAVPYKLVRAHDYFANEGVWAEPTIEGLAEAMRWVYEHRLDTFIYGLRAYETVKKMTIKRMQDGMVETVLKYG